MTKLQQIQGLLTVSKKQLSEIEERYKLSLSKKSIDPELQVLIKNYLENLRSSLDYVAAEIWENILGGSKGKKIYFPIVKKHQSINDFKSLIGKYLPGLDSKRKDIFDILEKIQPYHSDYEWLADFATLVNDNKHQELTPQERKEIQRITVENINSGGKVSWDPNAVKFGSGVYILGAPVDPTTQMPIPTPYNKVVKEIWVDFIFKTINQSALVFLKQAYSGVEKIIIDISQLIKNDYALRNF